MSKLTPDERVRLLEARLGASFLRPELAATALTHKSYVNERGKGQQDNERLEFLGDAVVDLAIGHRLMERFPAATEGELSRLRALLVDEEGLSRVARRVGLGELLLLGRGEDMSGGRDKSSVLADALEAVMGALYLGSGMEAVMTVVDRHFAEPLDEVTRTLGRDFKTRFQEFAQERLKQTPRYQVVSEAGPDHEKIFEVEVALGTEAYARASGRSKKEAEQAAARSALELVEQGLKPADKPTEGVGQGAPEAAPGPKDDTPA